MNTKMIQAVLMCASGLMGCAAQSSTGAASPTVASADACRGISATDEDPFANPHGVTAVEPLKEGVTVGKISWMQLRGATLSVAATPSMTKQWLAKTAECHFSRHPIGASAVLIAIGETTKGFVVALRTTDQLDRSGAEQILRSSEVAWSPSSTSQQASR